MCFFGLRAFVRLTVFALCVVLSPPVGADELPAGKGSDLVYAKCVGCHDMGVVTNSAGISRAMWEQVIKDMRPFGYEVTPEENKIIIDYLATYLGPDPPPTRENPTKSATSLGPSGSTLYDRHCGGCHQQDGKGVAQQFPPLAGNPYLLKDRLYNVLVVLYGLEGQVRVDKQVFTGVMPALPQLGDAQIAALTMHVLTSWGNDKRLPDGFEPVRSDEVRRARTKRLTPQQVRIFREKL